MPDSVINGERLEVLVLPYGECIPADMLPLLSEMTDAGVKVIFVDDAPKRAAGSMQAADQMLADIVTGSSVIARKELGKELRAYRSVLLDDEEPDLAVGEYERGGKRYYMFFNENVGTAIHTRAVLNTKGYVYRYDALNDTLYLACQKEGGMELELEPYESAVFVVSREPLEAEVREEYTDWRTIPLPETWDVSYADSMSYPDFHETVPVSKLGFIHQIEGWDNKAGTVRFAAELKVDKISGAVLDLGEAHEIAEVFVNGISAGIRLCRPYVFELGELLKPGKNELAVEITNTLGTAVREPLSHYLVIEPFGVQGPVTLKIRTCTDE